MCGSWLRYSIADAVGRIGGSTLQWTLPLDFVHHRQGTISLSLLSYAGTHCLAEDGSDFDRTARKRTGFDVVVTGRRPSPCVRMPPLITGAEHVHRSLWR